MAEKEYIEREKLGIGRCNPEVFEDKGYAKGWNAAIDIIQSAPAADVRPAVRSKWIKMRFFPDWECEKCGSVISGNTPDPWNHYHYCPNCGARMEES